MDRVNPSPVKAIACFCCLVYLGLFIQLVLDSATWGFMGLSLPWVLMLGGALAVFALPAAVILCLLGSFLARRGWWLRWLNSRRLMIGGCLLFAAMVAWACHSATPRQRYASIVGVAGEHATEIEVIGFNSFLARRWLVAFKIPPEHVPQIVSRWGLKEIPPFSLRDRVRKGMLGESSSPMIQDAPEAEGTRCFDSEEVSGGGATATWTTLVVRESDQRAWFFSEYQN